MVAMETTTMVAMATTTMVAMATNTMVAMATTTRQTMTYQIISPQINEESLNGLCHLSNHCHENH